MPKNKTPKRSGFNTQKIFKYVRIGALALPAAAIAVGPGDPGHKIRMGVRKYFGYSIAENKFRLSDLVEGWTPYVASVAVTYGIPKLAGFIRGFGK